ncbi:methyltransferase-like protein 17, mitochondrial [Galendromus occidentalis]|uniref:Methyltransferase-like protein 17, mitochondrial n=1 Tax=Galendromus occidentalis TaxID=34638 RepID=A0AAJ7L397_9ACAR|nr:methyltransferase-like protein 17, mitochondrial [Galendromus occidentalis]
MYALCSRILLRRSSASVFRGLCSEPAPQNPEYRRKANRLVPLPPELVKAVENVLADRDLDKLQADGQLLHRQLWSRREPIETREIQERAGNLQWQMFGDRLSRLDSEQRELVEPQIKEAIVNKLRKTTYHWTPVNYDDYGSLCYLLGRFPYEFAALRNVFREICIIDPLFAPQTCLDFGSGIGTVWWVMRDLYNASFNEYLSVDIQRPMRDLARQLVAGGDPHGSVSFEVYAQRAKLPASVNTKYDVAVSAFSLLELPNQRERLATIETLWEKTQRHLIILENGNHTGFKLVSEARKFILEISNHANQARSYVLAPCTHNLPCQRSHSEMSKLPCSFPVKYASFESSHVGRCSYSYVVLSKVRPKCEPAARIIENVLPRTRHVTCRLCTSKGQVEEKIFTKRKHDKEVYSAARRAEWGDLFPHEDIPSARTKTRSPADTP